MARFVIDRLKRTEVSKKFGGLNRRKRLLRRRQFELQKGLIIFSNIGELRDDYRVMDYEGGSNFPLNEDNKPMRYKLGKVARIDGDLYWAVLTQEEIEIKEKYRLSSEEIAWHYREEAKSILSDGKDICSRLGIPVVNPFECKDAYRRVLYYVAELLKNQREIRADFFKAVS